MTDKYLVANTTREEREAIVLEALGGEPGCEDDVSDAAVALYRPYIDGLCEMNECTRAYSARYVKGGMEMPPDSGCGWAR